jgi:hypothetical protein
VDQGNFPEKVKGDFDYIEVDLNYSTPATFFLFARRFLSARSGFFIPWASPGSGLQATAKSE